MQLAEIHSDQTIYIFIVPDRLPASNHTKIARPIIQELWKELIGFFPVWKTIYRKDDCLDIDNN